MSKNEASLSYTLISSCSYLLISDEVRKVVDAPNKLSCKIGYLGMNKEDNSFGLVYTSAYYITDPAEFSIQLCYAAVATFPDPFDDNDVQAVYDETMDAVAKRICLVISFITDQVFGSPVSLPQGFDAIEKEPFGKYANP